MQAADDRSHAQVNTSEIATTAKRTIAAAITKSYRSGLKFLMTPTLAKFSGVLLKSTPEPGGAVTGVTNLGR
jgi:hypothetical protein